MAKRRWTRDPVALVVAALASYRLTRLVTTDHLPFVVDARNKLERATPLKYQMLWTCPWCFGFWSALAVTVTGEIAERRGHRDAFLLAATPWAISTVSGMIAEREVN
jgi:hypothetical protein